MLCPMQNSHEFSYLFDYTAQKLTPEARAAVESHLATCVECRDALESQRQVWSALNSWNALPVSSDFDRKLYSRIEDEEPATFWERAFVRPYESLRRRSAVMPFAAACVTICAAFLLQVPSYMPVQTYHDRSRLEAVEAEQLDRTLEDLDMLRQLSVPAGTSQQL